MKHRCGYCGNPCNEEGEPIELSIEEIESDIIEWDGAEQVQGLCCAYQALGMEPEMVQITREMAMDAQDLSLEGQWIEW